MDDKEVARAAVREFLGTRRARVTPTDAGLPPQNIRRRVTGLRREEVALLAGISPEYHVRLERGQATGPSAGVVDAVARVLRLDDVERAHLDRLLTALAPGARTRRRVPAKDPITPGMRVLLDATNHLPAVVFNGRLDILAVNALGRALYAPVYDLSGRPNSARFLFLDEPRAPGRVPRVGPHRRRHRGDVADRSPPPPRRPRADRADRSALHPQHRVPHPLGRQRRPRPPRRREDLPAPLIGQVTLPFENLHVGAVPGQVLTVFTPRPGTPEADAIRLLASWNADEQTTGRAAGTSSRTPGSPVLPAPGPPLRHAGGVRKQYHFWPADRGFDAWDVDRLIELSRGLPVEHVPIDSIGEIDTVYWFAGDELPTVRGVVEHARLISEVDVSYPIILGHDGRVMDGMHRVARALLEGRTGIDAVRMPAPVEPDHRRCWPHELPY